MLDAVLQPTPYKLMTDPTATWALIGAMGSTAVGGILYVGRFFLRSARARKAIGVSLGLDEHGNTDLTKVLIEFVRNMEQDRQTDRNQETRQWERIEDIFTAINSQATEIKDLANGMNNIASHFQQLYQQNAATLSRVENSQVNLAIWIYQNMGRPGAAVHNQQSPVPMPTPTPMPTQPPPQAQASR